MFVHTHHTLGTGLTESAPTRRGPVIPARVGGSAVTPAPRGVIAIPEDAALVLIDIEPTVEGVGTMRSTSVPRARNNPDADVVAGRLLAEWRATRRPVIHVRHASASASRLRAGAPRVDAESLAHVRTGEGVYQRRRGSAFADTSLAKDLVARHIRTLVIAGLATDTAVASTVRAAADMGFTTIVVSDASAAFDREGPDGARFPAELVHQTTLASLHSDVAIVLSSALVLEGVARASASV